MKIAAEHMPRKCCFYSTIPAIRAPNCLEVSIGVTISSTIVTKTLTHMQKRKKRLEFRFNAPERRNACFTNTPMFICTMISMVNNYPFLQVSKVCVQYEKCFVLGFYLYFLNSLIGHIWLRQYKWGVQQRVGKWCSDCKFFN